MDGQASSFALALKPQQYEALSRSGLQIRKQFEVPKGEFWLRSGVYDPASNLAGTLEIPLSAVKDSAEKEAAPGAR